MNRLMITLAVTSLAGSAVAAAQTDAGAVEIARSFRIESRTLSETRVVDVALPAGYDTRTDQRYPVLYVLDGEFEGGIAIATARFYADMSMLPPMIVVSVRNIDRTRDMTPVAAAGFSVPREAATAGRADRFLSFFADELVPWVDRTWRTAPMRVLVGHSLGGLFALHALANRPALFNGYLVMEPAEWWNNGRPLEAAREALTQPAGRRLRVMLVNTRSIRLDTTSWGGARPMVRHLSTNGETHSSMALAGMMSGLRTMFEDFKPTQWRPGTRPIAMLERYDSLTERVGYAVPIPASAFQTVFRMSVDSRHFDDAQRVIDRLERGAGPTDQTRTMRERLTEARSNLEPGFIPLEFPARRPTPREARGFIGHWISTTGARPNELVVRVAGDTIVTHNRVPIGGDGSTDVHEADDPVIQVTPDGVLEWGLPFFRGMAALVVLKGRLNPDGTMTVTREARGWVPQGPGGNFSRSEIYRRVSP